MKETNIDVCDIKFFIDSYPQMPEVQITRIIVINTEIQKQITKQ